MSNIRTSFAGSEKMPKFLDGPTSSSPGPMLLNVAATAVKFVIRSSPSNARRNTDSENSNVYATINTLIDRTTSCSTTFPSILILRITCGCRNWISSFLTVFTSTTRRDTLTPPPVLPAQAPININNTRIVFEACGQRSKSWVAKPVVVIMEATWNEAWCSASPRLLYRPAVFTVIIPMETAIIIRYHRNSSVLNACPTLFIRIKK